MRVLVTGWFSFLHGEATAGDLMAMEVACDWLREAGVPFDVALSPVFGEGVDLERADPAAYSDLLFVCGPAEGVQLDGLLRRFERCRRIALDVSLLDGERPGFELLFERDSAERTRPDLSLLAASAPVPVVGVVRAHAQPEYHEGLHDEAHRHVDRLLSTQSLAVVEFDTRVDPREPGIRTRAEVEALVARMDALVTTRLHGLVLALRNGVPAVAIDPIAGGAKVQRQATALDWPVVFTADALDEEALRQALVYCLTPDARRHAGACARRAGAALETLRREFLSVWPPPAGSARPGGPGGFKPPC